MHVDRTITLKHEFIDFNHLNPSSAKYFSNKSIHELKNNVYKVYVISNWLIMIENPRLIIGKIFFKKAIRLRIVE